MFKENLYVRKMIEKVNGQDGQDGQDGVIQELNKYLHIEPSTILEENRQKTTKELEEVKSTIDKTNCEISELNDKISLMNYEIKNRWELEKEQEDTEIKLIQIYREIKSLQDILNPIINKINDRARYRGKEISENPRNKQIDKINQEIEEFQQEKDENELIVANVKIVIDKIKTYPECIRISKKQLSLLINEKKKLENNESKLSEILHSILCLKKEEEMFPQYIVYAFKHDLEYDKDDDFDIFRVCNNHYHGSLLNEQSVSCDICDRTYYIYSNNIGELSGSCYCERAYWNHKYPPEDLLEFNLDSTNTYGEGVKEYY